MRGLWRGIALFGTAIVVPALSLALPAVGAATGRPWVVGNPWTWIGWLLIFGAVALGLARPVCTLVRRLIGRWTGVPILDGYREAGPEPVQLATGHWWNGYSYERTRRDAEMDARWRRGLGDPAYWRDVRWIVLSVVVAPVALIAWRVVASLGQRFLRPPISTGERVRELELQRVDLTRTQAAEIRRIERDLHDGAQARLVAVGLSLVTAERLLDTDPERAKALLREAREGTSTSLAQLRDLVRGVHPPVLAERGLADAIRALALDAPLNVTVEVEGVDRRHAPQEAMGLGRLDAPLEAAAYFGVAELLANAAKYGAGPVRVRLQRVGALLVAEVTDSGSGGAVVVPGGGLDGIGRRLRAFDGTLTVDSPSGGPTMIRLELPCG